VVPSAGDAGQLSKASDRTPWRFLAGVFSKKRRDCKMDATAVNGEPAVVMGKLENRVAVITGGNSGTGLAMAKLFAAEGAIRW
jgi:hypothetical protein